MSSTVKGFLITVVILALIGAIVYFAVRIKPENETSILEHLPREAQILQELGNNWFIFKVGERSFLYHRERAGYHLGECITELQ
jgi:hypothetical protein